MWWDSDTASQWSLDAVVLFITGYFTHTHTRARTHIYIHRDIKTHSNTQLYKQHVLFSISLMFSFLHQLSTSHCSHLLTWEPSNLFTQSVSERYLESGGMILSVTLRSLYALVSHLCLTGLPEVAMPYSDMWQDCQITFPHTRPCYAKSSYRSVEPRPYMETSTRSTKCQMDWPTPPRQQQCSHCDSVEASYWSRSLESDATVRDDYALTTMTLAVQQMQ